MMADGEVGPPLSEVLSVLASRFGTRNESASRCKTNGSTQDLTFTDRPVQRLLGLLVARRGLGVTDPRDVVFAHLGMIGMQTKALDYRYQSNKTEASDEETITIDYDKDVVKVYEETARFLLRDATPSDLLAYKEVLDQAESRTGLPSWIPDWTRQWNARHIRKDSILPERQNPKDWHLFPAPGLLAVSGKFAGVVRAMLPVSILPKTPCGLKHPPPLFGRSQFPHVQRDQCTFADHVAKWITICPDQVSQTLTTILEYLIEDTCPIDLRNMTLEDIQRAMKESHNQTHHLAGNDLNILNQFIQPLISRWTHELFAGKSSQLGQEESLRERILVPMLIRNFTRLIDDSSYGEFTEGYESLALVSGRFWTPVSSGIRVGDLVFHFPGISAILRPIEGRKHQATDAMLRHESAQYDKKQRKEVLHCKYIAPCKPVRLVYIYDHNGRTMANDANLPFDDLERDIIVALH